MEVESCIFVDRPKECYIQCASSRKVKCLLNHMHLKVTEAGRRELMQWIGVECLNPDRYKSKSGQVGRTDSED